jgi:hypothetical protein
LEKKPVIVIVRNFGQLGNRLWLAAHLIAAAREYGVTLVNPSFAEYAKYFPSTATDLWCRHPLTDSGESSTSKPPSDALRRATYKSIYLSGKALWYSQRLGVPVPMIRLGKEESCDLGSEEFKRRAQTSTALLVSGWQFRSVTLLEKHSQAIREHFEIIPEHRSRVTTLLDRVRQQADYVVGVHIRHGDYAKFENGRYFFTVSQYVAAMHRVQQQLRDRKVAFLVCGNAKLDRHDFGELNVHFGTGHLIEDMYAFAETDLLIGPPSTYTGWASFFGQTPLQILETAEQRMDVSWVTSKQDRAAA